MGLGLGLRLGLGLGLGLGFGLWLGLGPTIVNSVLCIVSSAVWISLNLFSLE